VLGDGFVECLINISSPLVGSVFVDPQTVELIYTIRKCVVPDHGTLFARYHKRGVENSEVQCDCDREMKICHGSIMLSLLEAGTHGISLELVGKNGKVIHWGSGSLASVVFDVASESLQVNDGVEKVGYVEPEIYRGSLDRVVGTYRIAFVGTLEFDGQKSIWKEQLRRLVGVFEATYICFTGGGGIFEQFLVEENIFLDHRPLEFEGFDGTSQDVSLAVKSLISWVESIVPGKGCGGMCFLGPVERIRLVFPSFAHALLENMYGALAGHDLLVFANSRGLTDALLVQVARFSGVETSVMDFPNLFPWSEVRPSAIVAPSWNTLGHHSIRAIRGLRTVIHPGISVARFNGVRGSGDGRVRVGFVARLEPEKSPGLFLHLAKRLGSDRYDFVVIGDGSLRERLEDLARGLGLRKVTFAGALYGDELPAALGELDIVVNPSMKQSETFCIVNIEAMAMGVPVVSFGAGGVVDYLVHGVNGAIAKPLGIDSLVDGVRFVETKMDAMRKAAIKTCDRFHVERMVERYFDLYAWLLLNVV